MTSTDTDRSSVVPELDDKPGAGKNTRKPGDLKPCERCRSQHLKCVYDSEKCRRCERSGVECVRNTKKIRFRGVQISKLRGDRKKPNANGSSSGSGAKSRHVAIDSTKQELQIDENRGQETSMEDPSLEQDVADDFSTTATQGMGELTWQSPATVTNAIRSTLR